MTFRLCFSYHQILSFNLHHDMAEKIPDKVSSFVSYYLRHAALFFENINKSLFPRDILQQPFACIEIYLCSKPPTMISSLASRISYLFANFDCTVQNCTQGKTMRTSIEAICHTILVCLSTSRAGHLRNRNDLTMWVETCR